MENISDHLDYSVIRQIKPVYADKSYDSKIIRNYLKNRNILDCIPKRNFKMKSNKKINQNNYNKTRFVVEIFFA